MPAAYLDEMTWSVTWIGGSVDRAMAWQAVGRWFESIQVRCLGILEKVRIKWIILKFQNSSNRTHSRSQMLQTYQTNQGKTCVAFNGYEYIQHKLNLDETIQYWRCIRCNKPDNCPGYAKSPVGTNDLTVTKGHLHENNYAAVEARLVKEKIKKRAREHPNELPSILIQAVLSQVKPEALMFVPNRLALEATIRRERKKAGLRRG
uniref:FLYWCH-type domain-containing protein n=1 Tax=Panagrellus redivivus TaxID=6233 RepID=A0A7E4V5F0_PANRE